MAIKEQCLKCTHYGYGICKLYNDYPHYNMRPCNSFKEKEAKTNRWENESKGWEAKTNRWETKTNRWEDETKGWGTETNESPKARVVEDPSPAKPRRVQMPARRMFVNPFSFNGRIRRTEYWLSIIIAYSLIALVGATITNEYIQFLAVVLYFWFLLAQGTKRCHDRNNSGWFQIIPFYVLWMLFGDGDDHKNDYGVDPKGRDYQ